MAQSAGTNTDTIVLVDSVCVLVGRGQHLGFRKRGSQGRVPRRPFLKFTFNRIITHRLRRSGGGGRSDQENRHRLSRLLPTLALRGVSKANRPFGDGRLYDDLGATPLSRMHVPNPTIPVSFASSSSSSSLPIHQFGMTATTAMPYASHSMSSFSSSASLPQYEPAGSSEEEYDGYDALDDKQEDGDEHQGNRDQEGGRSRGSSNDQKDGVQKRKPRITLARGGACVVCRSVVSSTDAE